MKTLRIAAVNCSAPVGAVAANLQRIEHWTLAAADAGAGVICFPEMSISGYTNRRDILRWAQPLPGAASDALLRLARASGLVILAGLAEQTTAGDCRIAHLVAHPDGYLEVYRKIHLSPPEKAVYQPGDQVPLFTAAGFRFGIQLCYDAHFPELTTRMTQEGAEVIFIPHASPRGTAEQKYASWMRHLPARAFDNSLFVIACNQVGSNGLGLDFPGVSLVIDPAGQVVAADLSGGEKLLIADLEHSLLEHVRGHRMRHFFPHRRPEIYRPC